MSSTDVACGDWPRSGMAAAAIDPPMAALNSRRVIFTPAILLASFVCKTDRRPCRMECRTVPALGLHDRTGEQTRGWSSCSPDGAPDVDYEAPERQNRSNGIPDGLPKRRMELRGAVWSAGHAR